MPVTVVCKNKQFKGNNAQRYIVTISYAVGKLPNGNDWLKQFWAKIGNVRVEALVGQEVPLSLRYCLGPRPKLIAVEGERALLNFPNGARLWNVPLRGLVDDSGYWLR